MKTKGLHLAKDYKPANLDHIPVWHRGHSSSPQKNKKVKIERKKKFSSQNLFLSSSSLAIKKRANFFYTIQSNSPTKFRFFLIHGKGDLVAGYYVWVEYEKNIRDIRNKYLKYAFDKNIAIALQVNGAKQAKEPLSLSSLCTAKNFTERIKKYIKEKKLIPLVV